MDWRGKVVLITGASSGIGSGLARKLGKRGARLGLLARRTDMLHEMVGEIEAAGGTAIALQADVTDAAAVSAASDRLRAEFGPIDVLIANAGTGTTSHAPNLKISDVSRVFEVNVMGAVNSVAAVIPDMVKRGSGQLV